MSDEDGPPPRNNKENKILNHLRMVAEDVVPVGKAKVASAIVVRGKIKSVGVNQWRTDPLQRKFQTNEAAIHPHAEISAIKNFLKRHSLKDLEKATIYVVRRKMTGPDGHMVDGNAAPCLGCQKAIKRFKIKEVIYTTDKEEEDYA